jgi:site-specific DNA recombinase
LGYKVLEKMQDPGQSGASFENPEWTARDLVAAGVITFVLAQNRDRLARKPAYHYLLHREFGVYACKLRSLNDRGDDSPEGELMDGILKQLAKYERTKQPRRRAGASSRMPEGHDVGGSRPPYGFRYNEATKPSL